MTTDSGCVLIRTDARGIVSVQLNRPDVGNALDLSTAAALRDAFVALHDADEVRAVVLAGSGSNFCVGGDVHQMMAAPDRTRFLAELAGLAHDALNAMRSLPVPIIAAVRGAAAGAGLGLVLAADFVLADPSAKFLAAYAGVGLSPDCGVSVLLPAVIGVRRAVAMTLTGRVLRSDEAAEWGLVTEVCATSDLDARIEQLSAVIAGPAGRALGETARLMRAASMPHYAGHLAQEADTIARLGGGSEAGRLLADFTSRSSRASS